MKLITFILLASAVAIASMQSSNVNLSFSPESEKFAEATKVYQDIWNAEGKRIVSAMEEVSGLKFGNENIRAIVYEGISQSGYRDIPMKMRASYPLEIKKEALIHELGHRLNEHIKNRPADVDEHRLLFLYLYDVWVKLYGKSFADNAVEVEKKRKGFYDYESAWNWALAFTAQERAAKLKDIIGSNKDQKR